MSNLQILSVLCIIVMASAVILYKKGWIKPSAPAKPSELPPVFWIAITVAVMSGIFAFIRKMGW